MFGLKKKKREIYRLEIQFIGDKSWTLIYDKTEENLDKIKQLQKDCYDGRFDASIMNGVVALNMKHAIWMRYYEDVEDIR